MFSKFTRLFRQYSNETSWLAAHAQSMFLVEDKWVLSVCTADSEQQYSLGGPIGFGKRVSCLPWKACSNQGATAVFARVNKACGSAFLQSKLLSAHIGFLQRIVFLTAFLMQNTMSSCMCTPLISMTMRQLVEQIR
uniref:Uncharacterized protein n=1 Tax=Ixodes ricinus TaxID=34613 RepID=A0A0K8RCC0_IXORI